MHSQLIFLAVHLAHITCISLPSGRSPLLAESLFESLQWNCISKDYNSPEDSAGISQVPSPTVSWQGFSSGRSPYVNPRMLHFSNSGICISLNSFQPRRCCSLSFGQNGSGEGRGGITGQFFLNKVFRKIFFLVFILLTSFHFLCGYRATCFSDLFCNLCWWNSTQPWNFTSILSCYFS